MVTKSLKDGLPFSSTIMGLDDPAQTFQEATNSEFTAQAKIEWKNSKKKQSGAINNA